MSIAKPAITSAPRSTLSRLVSAGQQCLGAQLFLVIALLLLTSSAFGQTAANTGQITGVVTDPDHGVVTGTQVVLTNQETNAKITAVTNGAGSYTFPSLPAGRYVVEVNAEGFKPSVSAELTVAAGQAVTFDVALALVGVTQSVDISAGAVENAYRVEKVAAGGPLGTAPILDLPYAINVISRQLIDDTQARNFKEAAKYLPLVSFQEQQGPEVLRPETRGMQGSNMQNERKDGMGFAVTTPSALEEYEQIEVVNGLGGPLYGPANPSGMFNFVTKRPTDRPLRQIELGYEGNSVGTVHADLGGPLGGKIFGYRTNLVLADGHGYVTGSRLRRKLASVALDVHPSANTVIQGNYSYYNLFQHGYPGWFASTPSLTPPSTPGSKSILLPAKAPDPTLQGYGQSFSGVDMTSKIGEGRVKHDFSSTWQLVAGVLDQLSDRNLNTAVNQFIDNNGNYKTYLANSFSSLAPRFHVTSNLAYLTGKFKTGDIGHELVIGGAGYRFATYAPVTSPVKTALCTANTDQGVCQASISDPLVFAPPAAGIFSYAKTSPSTGIYVSSIIHQQGFNLGDTLTLNPHWLVRVAASQDWTWTSSYADTAATNYQPIGIPGGYQKQGVSPTASVMFKPRETMTIYGTFASSIQAPDAAAANSGSTIIVNASQALPPYRSTEGEVGYKLSVRKINFSTAVFRIKRPFANYATFVTSPVCGAQSGTSNCQEFKISGKQLTYGFETMVSGRIVESLMITGGLSVLDPKLTDTGVAATNNKTFVGKPACKSNILAEYQLPGLSGTFVNFDWQHVGRRPMDDINSTYTPQYNVLDLGVRYTTAVMGKWTTWRVTVNNMTDAHYWSTLGPGNITGQSTGSYLGHLGEPRLVTASMRVDF